MLNPINHLHSSASPVPVTGLALVLVALLSGCYHYVPVVGEDPSPGQEVRLRLDSPTSAQFSDRMGRTVRSVEGPLVGLTPDSLVVDVGWGAFYAGTVFEGRRDTLRFERSQLLEVDRKEFSRTRTGVLAAGFAVVVVAAIRAITTGGQGDGGGNGPGDPF